MRARAKVIGGAHERIMEIVGILLRTIIESPEDAGYGDGLMKGLKERGYERAEIDVALELVLAVPEIISSALTIRPRPAIGIPHATRIFSPKEETKLSMVVRGRLLQYRMLSLLSESEWEEVLMQLLLSDAREVGLADLYAVLHRFFNDKERVMLLLPDPTRLTSMGIN